MSLFVLASKDGWVDIMYDGLDAVGVDQQVTPKHTNFYLIMSILHIKSSKPFFPSFLS